MTVLEYDWKPLILVGVTYFLLPLTSMAQSGTPFTINSISFSGQKSTKESYLSLVTDLQKGDTLLPEQITKNRKYLSQLNNIANAEVRLDTIDQQVDITFMIEEARTLFPILNFGGVRDNFWFQVGITETNLFGRGNQLTAYYQNTDQRHNFNLYYRLPFLKGSRWGLSLNALRWASTEPVYFDTQTVFYDYNNNSYSGTVFYQIQSNHTIELGGTYFIEAFTKDERHDNENTLGPTNIKQPKLLFKIMHQINEVDYRYFYLNGFSNHLFLETVYNTDYQTWFNLLLNDFKYFKRLGAKGNLAFRFRLGLSTNDATPFAPFVLDSYVNIRGSGNRIDRGTAALVLNSEYRQTFWEGNLLAGQLVTFSDLGTWRNPGGDFEDLIDQDNFRHFIGGGIRLIYKKAFNSMLRVDYGVDVYDINQQGFVIGFGQYF